MTREVITINKDADIFEAKDKMTKHRIRHLPVVGKDNRIIGIVSDRDIRSALPCSLLKDYDTGKTTCLEIRSKSNDIIIVDTGTGIRRLGNQLIKKKSI